MGIKAIEEAPGLPARSYKKGHVFFCFKCRLWVRSLRNNEMCESCNKSAGIPKTISIYKSNESVEE